MELKRAKINCFAISDYILDAPINSKKLFILLHGYLEDGEAIYSKLKHLIPKESTVLAINGPFPIPKKREKKYDLKFAWYFYDNLKEEYFIDFELASALISQLVKDLKLENLPTYIIGYSQGGYLAPFAGLELKNIKGVLGIGCVFRHQFFEKTPLFKIDGIHGELDLLVSPERAKEHHQVISQLGVSGSFQIVKDEGHKLTNAFDEAISSSIKGLIS